MNWSRLAAATVRTAVPLVPTLLHREQRRPPVVTGQTEQVVALGALVRVVEQGTLT